MPERYQGWTNRATCAIYLWLDSDEALCREATGIPNSRQLEEFIRERADCFFKNVTGNDFMWYDLISTAIEQVNWDEIYAHLH